MYVEEETELISFREAARRLRITRPRVVRAVIKLGIPSIGLPNARLFNARYLESIQEAHQCGVISPGRPSKRNAPQP